jgi:hypothetical protein
MLSELTLFYQVNMVVGSSFRPTPSEAASISFRKPDGTGMTQMVKFPFLAGFRAKASIQATK